LRLQVQNPGLRPPEGALNVDAGTLMPGDIILSAAKGATSLGIRLLTLSAVSHASLYVGDSQVAEAVGDGIRRRKMEQFLDEESTVAAFRHPGVQPEHVEKMQAFVAETVPQGPSTCLCAALCERAILFVSFFSTGLQLLNYEYCNAVLLDEPINRAKRNGRTASDQRG
jgi:hypothetical protein